MTPDWQSAVQIGSLVRIPDTVYLGQKDLPPANSPSTDLSAGHSFIVVGGNQTYGWLVVDDTNPYDVTVGIDPSNNEALVQIESHTFNQPGEQLPLDGNILYGYVLTASVAYVSTLTSALPPSTVVNTTGSQSTLVAPLTNSTVYGDGYDIL